MSEIDGIKDDRTQIEKLVDNSFATLTAILIKLGVNDIADLQAANEFTQEAIYDLRNKTVSAIAQLSPQGDKNGLLSDEEIAEILAVGEQIEDILQVPVDKIKAIAKALQALTLRLDAEKREKAVEEAVEAEREEAIQEINSIMEEAPDLKELEKQIAGWLGINSQALKKGE